MLKRSAFQPPTKEKLADLNSKKLGRLKEKAKTPLRRSKLTSKAIKPKKREKTQVQLKKELDSVFSLYIRTKYADPAGNSKCYTCGKWGTIKTMQCGHFISRQYLATRWHENNTRNQCAGCNLFGNGKPLDFEENLKKELGSKYVENMKKSRHEVLKLDRNWYKEKIEHYKNLLHEKL
jgi:hypothetical protein